MEDSVASFPFLQLPDNALKCALQNINLLEQVGFSILSKRSKILVKSLNLKVHQIIVTIGGRIVMSVLQSPQSPEIAWHFHSEQFYKDGYKETIPLSTKIFTPDCLRTFNVEEGRYDECDWKKPGFKIKDWIDLFLYLFNRLNLDRLYFYEETPFDLISVQKQIKYASVINIGNNLSVEHIHQIVQNYPSTRELMLSLDAQKNLRDFHNIFCQRFDVLGIRSPDRNQPPKWRLDNLLMIHSRIIQICNTNLLQADVNKFLKHWINGHNPRLEYMMIGFPRNTNPIIAITLNGLDYQTVPPEQERMFEETIGSYVGPSTVIVKGGFDIQRRDGTTATIVVQQQQQQSYYLEMFVWN